MTMRILTAAAMCTWAMACGGGPVADAGTMIGPCGVVNEVEPNQTRDTAAAYAFGTPINGCLDVKASPADEDWYEFTAPNDMTGGFVQMQLTHVGNGTIQGSIYAVSDNGEIRNEYSSGDGANLSLFFSAKAGAKYRVAIENIFAADSPYKYTMQTTYTKVVDMYEPNDTRADAKAITLGTSVNGTLFAGFSSGSAPGDDDYADWFSVTLAANKAVQVKLENVPTSLNGHLVLYDNAGAEVASLYSANEGASVTLDVTANKISTAGTYYVLAKKIFVTGDAAGKGDVYPPTSPRSTS